MDNTIQEAFDLAVKHVKGDGVEKNLQKATVYFMQAATAGHSKAQYNLGVMYANGIGVKKDQDQAINWLSLASKQGNAQARHALEKLYSALIPKETSPEGRSTTPEAPSQNNPTPILNPSIASQIHSNDHRKIICKQCATENDTDSLFCTGCGVKLSQSQTDNQKPLNRNSDASSAANCPYCRETIHSSAIKCKHCGEILHKSEYTEQKFQWKEDYDRTGIQEYYLEKFRAFDENRGRFAPRFNGYALAFGLFWYLYKGMWVKGAIMAVAIGAFAGVPAIVFWAYCGLAGNYDYYLFKTQGKQLW